MASAAAIEVTSTAAIGMASALDFEDAALAGTATGDAQPFYKLVVEASQGDQKIECTAQITVTDVNEAARLHTHDDERPELPPSARREQ